MKYIAHLSTGGTVELHCTEELDRLAIADEDWLLDNRGTLVRWSAVQALVVVERRVEAAGEVVALVDKAGDRWERVGDDQFSFLGRSNIPDSREYIERAYGPVKEVRE